MSRRPVSQLPTPLPVFWLDGDPGEVPKRTPLLSILRQEFADAGPLRHHARDAQIHTFERLRQVARGAIVLSYQRVEIIAQLFSRFGIAEISAHVRQAGAEAETENARVALHELVEVRLHKLEWQLARGRGTLPTEQQQESVNQFHSAGEHLLHSGLNRGGVAEIGHGAEQAALILPILRLFELGQKTLEEGQVAIIGRA